MPERTTTYMAAEIGETPGVAARLLAREGAAIRALGVRLRALDPDVVVTCARGSSDNAASYFKYLSEILLGVPVASIGPSVASLYGAPLRLRNAVVVSVSQSGQSPDIVALQAAARAAGAFSIAVVNHTDSPLADAADAVLPLHAGEEASVAATKSCLASALALAALVAEWRDDGPLRDAVAQLPAALDAARSRDWGEALPVFETAQSAYVVGRGPALPVAAEAALKLKETCALHAEAFSGAEVMHGPLQLVDAGFPVIAFSQRDAAHGAMRGSIDRLRETGGRVFEVSPETAGPAAGPARPDHLAAAATGHPALDPLAMLLSFYAFAERLSRARGHDPDRPSRLRKVTETV
jgi:glutamine---fructose-6-phosphate transaminase (isomerizing)